MPMPAGSCMALHAQVSAYYIIKTRSFFRVRSVKLYNSSLLQEQTFNNPSFKSFEVGVVMVFIQFSLYEE